MTPDVWITCFLAFGRKQSAQPPSSLLHASPMDLEAVAGGADDAQMEMALMSRWKARIAVDLIGCFACTSVLCPRLTPSLACAAD